MVTILIALLSVLAVFTGDANAYSLHLCSAPNFVSGTITTTGHDPRRYSYLKAKQKLFVDAATIYCKLDGLLLTKAAPSRELRARSGGWNSASTAQSTAPFLTSCRKANDLRDVSVAEAAPLEAVCV